MRQSNRHLNFSHVTVNPPHKRPLRCRRPSEASDEDGQVDTGDCLMALERVMARGEVVEFREARPRYFGLQDVEYGR